MPKLLRTLRLDPSDTFVFDRAAESGEWAVTGSSLFADVGPDELAPKMRTAFRSGFLGLRSMGFSTLVEVTQIGDDQLESIRIGFSRRISEMFGAPMEVASELAEDELAFSSSLCDHDVGTVVAMHRRLDQGSIKEQFRTLHRRDMPASGSDRLHAYARAFEIVEVDEPEEQVDLLGLMRKS
jgi:Family of unknown function (DUF6505)